MNKRDNQSNKQWAMGNGQLGLNDKWHKAQRRKRKKKKKRK